MGPFYPKKSGNYEKNFEKIAANEINELEMSTLADLEQLKVNRKQAYEMYLAGEVYGKNIWYIRGIIQMEKYYKTKVSDKKLRINYTPVTDHAAG